MASILKVDTIQDQSGNNIINESGDTITIGASGDTITVPTGASLTVPNGGLSGQNYPAFFVRRSNDQVIGSDSTYVKIQFPTEVLDTDNCFDNVTNYRFTPNVAGKYLFFVSLSVSENNTDGIDAIYLQIRKNGVSSIFRSGFDFGSHGVLYAPLYLQVVFDMNGSTDYVESYGYLDSNNFGGTSEVFDNQGTFFGGYRIGD